jgi:hypothetical protein
MGNLEVQTAVAFTGPGPTVIPIKTRAKADYSVQLSSSVLTEFAVTAKTTSSFTLTTSASGAMLLDIQIQ